MREDKTVEELEEMVSSASESGDFRQAQRLQRRLERARAQDAPPSRTSTRDTEAARRARASVREDASAAAANRRLTTIAGISIAVAIGATAMGGYATARAVADVSRVEGDMVKAVVASSDIEPGTTLAATDLTVADVPAAFLPADPATDPADLVGLKTITSQRAGMAVPLSSVTASPSPSSLPTAIAEGTVALTVALEPAAAASPLLSVGDRVDVLGAASDGTVTSSTVVAGDVRVVALDGRLTGGGGDGYSSVTLELDPDAAARVSAASHIHLAVRPMAQADGGERNEL